MGKEVELTFDRTAGDLIEDEPAASDACIAAADIYLNALRAKGEPVNTEREQLAFIAGWYAKVPEPVVGPNAVSKLTAIAKDRIKADDMQIKRLRKQLVSILLKMDGKIAVGTHFEAAAENDLWDVISSRSFDGTTTYEIRKKWKSPNQDGDG